jgi:hypothetical protein
MTWQVSAAANGVIGIAYLVIAYIILGGLIRTNQLMLIPSLGIHDQQALEETLKKARLIIPELLGDEDSEVALGPGELRRQRPATVAGSDAPR